MNRKVRDNLHSGWLQGKSVLLGFCLLFLGMVACSAGGNQPEHADEQEVSGPRLFYMNEERTKVVSEPYHVEGYALGTKVANMLTALEQVLWTQTEIEQLAEKNPIVGFEVKADEVLLLQFASDYSMVKAERTVSDEALVKAVVDAGYEAKVI